MERLSQQIEELQEEVERLEQEITEIKEDELSGLGAFVKSVDDRFAKIGEVLGIDLSRKRKMEV